MTGSLIETPPSAIARSPMIEHDIMRRVREWMAGGPPPHGLPFSSANLQTRGAQPRTALTKPPFSWIDHLIRPLQEGLGDGQAEGLGGPEVDHQLELRRLLDGEVGRLRAFQDLVHVRSCATIEIREIRGPRASRS